MDSFFNFQNWRIFVTDLKLKMESNKQNFQIILLKKKKKKRCIKTHEESNLNYRMYQKWFVIFFTEFPH